MIGGDRIQGSQYNLSPTIGSENTMNWTEGGASLWAWVGAEIKAVGSVDGTKASLGAKANLAKTFDFTSATGWVTYDHEAVGTGGVTIDSSTDNRIEGSSAPLEHHDRVVYDLGQAVSDTEWTLDFDFNVSAISTHRAFMPCSLSSVPMLNSANNLTTPLYDNSMGIQFNDNSGTRYFQSKVIKTGATLDETGTQTLSLNTTYYARCQRTSATEMKIQLFANASHRTAGTPTSHSTTITESDHAGVTDLRYIVVGCAGLGNNPETTSFWVDNIKLVATAKNDEFDLPENTLFEETDTYQTYWLQSAEWKNTYTAASILSLGGATDGDFLSSYSAASGWGSALATYPFSGGMFACAGNAVNAQFAQGHYTNGQSYKYYGSSNTYSADVGSGLYQSSNGGSGGEQDNMIVFGGNKGGGGSTHIVNSEKCSKYTGASTWTTCGVLSKKYREVGGGSGTPTSAICVCGEAGGSSSFPDYDSVENYSGASDAWSTNSTAFPINFNNGIYFGTATEGVGGMGDSQAAGAPRSETYYTTNSGDTWSSSQNNTYDGYGVGCAGTSSDAGLAWCGNNWATSTSYSTTNDYSKASGWSNSGNSYAHTSYNIRGTGNASG
jgi:hypothetical protein